MPAEQIGRALAGRGQVLLILDNMEHLMRHASATLGRWLTLAPDTRFLVTSREAMRLPGEWVLDLAPLGLPAEDETSLEAISRSDAVRLFVQRAQAAQGDFVLTAEEAPQVAEIVRRLDGIALAIELAAARTPVLGVAQIRERLSRRFELLRIGRRDAWRGKPRCEAPSTGAGTCWSPPSGRPWPSARCSAAASPWTRPRQSCSCLRTAWTCWTSSSPCAASPCCARPLPETSRESGG